jgi:flagellar motor switch protein FliN/FliY
MQSRSQADAPSVSPRNGAAEIVLAPKGAPLVALDAAIFKDVNVALKVRLGEFTITIEDLLALKAGSVVTLDAKLNDLVELRLNDSVVARGEIVAVGDNFGVRIVDVATAT